MALFAGAAAFAEASVVVKWVPRRNAISKNAIGMVGGTLLLLASLIVGERQVAPTRTSTWTAIAYLVVPGSVVVFSLALFVLDRWTVSAASYQFVLYPFASVPLSMWLLDETVSGTFLVGAILAMAGVYVGALSNRGNLRE